MKCIPLRIEIGPRDIENGQMFVARRDTCEKTAYALGDVSAIDALLKDIQSNMLEKSRKLRDSKVVWAENLEL